jgi:hypothetical protein
MKRQSPLATISATVSTLSIVLVLATACRQEAADAAPGAADAAADTAPLPTGFVLRGTLVDRDDRPLVGADVWVYRGDTIAFLMEIGEGGVLLNPTGETDDEGRFEIQVNRDFLPEGREIKLACHISSYPPRPASPITDEMGITVVLVVDPRLEVLDLNEIAGKIVVER